ncbi:MAG TPA: lysophospholipid acyltransferase family protein [Fimbriimonas sp.]|nr:lysophospholipid acyltransferase family protein [Fimbriimonas sp.]
MAERPRLYEALWLPLARIFVGIFFFLFGPYRIRGAYRVPRKGPVLILSNHISDFDPPMVQFACPRPLRFMAKSELFEMKVIGPLLRFFGAFPVKRGEPDRNSIRLAVDYLKAGEAVGIFPEGQLSETGELQELKGGVSLIIRMAACPVICCGVKNLNRVLPYGSVIPRPAFRTLEVNWGEVREFSKDSSTEEILAWVRGQLATVSE